MTSTVLLGVATPLGLRPSMLGLRGRRIREGKEGTRRRDIGRGTGKAHERSSDPVLAASKFLMNRTAACWLTPAQWESRTCEEEEEEKVEEEGGRERRRRRRRRNC